LSSLDFRGQAKDSRGGRFDFWTNLKEGHDHFERTKVPPEVTVEDVRYRFK